MPPFGLPAFTTFYRLLTVIHFNSANTVGVVLLGLIGPALERGRVPITPLGEICLPRPKLWAGIFFHGPENNKVENKILTGPKNLSGIRRYTAASRPSTLNDSKLHLVLNQPILVKQMETKK